jgi:DNA-3-methyladenine glycosylase I
MKYHDEEWAFRIWWHYSIWILLLETFKKSVDNILNRENFKAAFDHFDYKKIRNILMIKFKIYYKMLVSSRNKLKVFDVPTLKISSQFKKNLKFSHIWAL